MPRLCIFAITLIGFFGCARSLPPEVPEFKRPITKVTEQTQSELAAAPTSPPPANNLSPPPARAPATPVPVPAVPATAPQSAKAPAPTLIGTWRVAEMFRNGQAMPMPGGMSISMTFAEGGAVTMNMSGGPNGAGGNHQGSYTLNANQITMTISNDTKSGTVNLESNDRAILELQETRMVLVRSSL